MRLKRKQSINENKIKRNETCFKPSIQEIHERSQDGIRFLLDDVSLTRLRKRHLVRTTHFCHQTSKLLNALLYLCVQTEIYSIQQSQFISFSLSLKTISPKEELNILQRQFDLMSSKYLKLVAGSHELVGDASKFNEFEAISY